MDKAIGIFDSGLGGLTAFKELSQLLPHENIIYFGDTGRVPYGNKSQDTIMKYASQDINFLSSLGVKMIIAACGTVSSVIPQMNLGLQFPFTGVVMPTATAAYNATKNKRIGVIGTSATISSSSYARHLKLLDPSVCVFEKECPLFVPLVENGMVSPQDQIVKLVIRKYLSEMKDYGIDTLILGCTHYPLLSEAIESEMGTEVCLINSGKEAANYAAKSLKESGLLISDDKQPNYEFYVSDRIDNFAEFAKLFLGREISNEVKQIDIEQY